MSLDEVILRIIESGHIPDQQSLSDRLVQEGCPVTQSTLSRHLRKLGIRKQNGRYVRMQEPDFNNKFVLGIVAAPPNLLVVRTFPGHAHALGYRLDSGTWDGIAGTVAGDDTLFLAVTAPDRLVPLKQELEKFFGIAED